MHRLRTIQMRLWALTFLFLFMFLLPSVSFAETDVSDKIEIQKSRLRYDRRAKTSSLNVSLKNISADVLLTPIKLVIDNISDSTVSVANADGVTDDGMPYFEYVTNNGQLLSGGVIDEKRLIFDNPNRRRFRYNLKLQGIIPNYNQEVGVEGATIEINDEDSPLRGTKIIIPEGSVPTNTTITMHTINPSQSLPSNSFSAGGAVEFGPDGTQFEKPVTITLPYYDVDNDGFIDGTNISEELLGVKIFSQNNGFWEGVQVIKIDTDSNLITFRTTHFSTGIPIFGDIHSDIFNGATKVEINTIDTGVVNSDTDVDFFKVYIHRPGILEIRTVGQINTNIKVYDSSYNIIANSNYVCFGESSMKVDIDPGNQVSTPYYIEVTNDGSSNFGSYHIGVDFYYKTANATVFPITYSTHDYVNLDSFLNMQIDNAISTTIGLGLSTLGYSIPGVNIFLTLATIASVMDELYDPIQVGPIACNLDSSDELTGELLMTDQAVFYNVMIDFIGRNLSHWDVSRYDDLYAGLSRGLINHDDQLLLSKQEMGELNPYFSYIIVPDRPLNHEIDDTWHELRLEVGVYTDNSDIVNLGSQGDYCYISFTRDGQSCFPKLNGYAVVPQVDIDGHQSIALKSDGSVYAAGFFHQRSFNGWSNIEQVAAGNMSAIGLKEDGTAVSVSNVFEGNLDVTSWTNIKQIAAGSLHAVGLKKDGTVIGTGNNISGCLNVSSWSNIQHIYANNVYTIGVKDDGTIIATGPNSYGEMGVQSWTDIKQIAIGSQHIIGLKNDGSIVSVGRNDYGQRNVQSWSNIVQISAGGSKTIGLKSNGEVVATGRNYNGELNINSWQNVKQISTSRYGTIAFTEDGLILHAGSSHYSLAGKNLYIDTN